MCRCNTAGMGRASGCPSRQGGLFKKGNALVVEARRQVAEGGGHHHGLWGAPRAKAGQSGAPGLWHHGCGQGPGQLSSSNESLAIPSQKASPEDLLSLGTAGFPIGKAFPPARRP